MRGLDGSPAVRLGDGRGLRALPGRTLGADREDSASAGQIDPAADRRGRAAGPSTIGNLTCRWANWFPDGRTDRVLGERARARGSRSASSRRRRRRQPRADQRRKGCAHRRRRSISPDGRSIVARAARTAAIAIYPAERRRAAPGSRARRRTSVPLRWTADGRALYVARFGERPPGIVDVVDVATGRRTPLEAVRAARPDGHRDQVGPAVIARTESPTSTPTAGCSTTSTSRRDALK